MIFLPNKFERYTSALRNYIHLSAIKQGITQRHLRLLSKIYAAEALFGRENVLPTDIKCLSENLLLAAQLYFLESGQVFHFKAKRTGNFLINPKLYTALLLSLCKKSTKAEVFTEKEKIIIKGVGFNPYCKRFIKALNGGFIYERKTEALLIWLPAERTDKKAIETEKEWEFYLNPFSPVNIFLNQ